MCLTPAATKADVLRGHVAERVFNFGEVYVMLQEQIEGAFKTLDRTDLKIKL
jgi:hypothetical protein